MTPLNFVYWLQGFLEIGQPETFTKEQVQEIKNHIALVLKKETPNTEGLNTTFCSSTYFNRKENIPLASC